jgi:hypothetical protein
LRRVACTREIRDTVSSRCSQIWPICYEAGYADPEAVTGAVLRALQAPLPSPAVSPLGAHTWEFHDTEDRHYGRPDDPLKAYPCFDSGDLHWDTARVGRFILLLCGAEDTDLYRDIGQLLATNWGHYDYGMLRERFARPPRADWAEFNREVLGILDALDQTGLPKPYKRSVYEERYGPQGRRPIQGPFVE